MSLSNRLGLLGRKVGMMRIFTDDGDAVPVTILLDRAGTPRFRMVGEIKEAQLRERLDWLLGSQSGDAPQELTLPDGMSVDHFKDDHEAGESEEHKHEEEQAAKEGGSAVPG